MTIIRLKSIKNLCNQLNQLEFNLVCKMFFSVAVLKSDESSLDGAVVNHLLPTQRYPGSVPLLAKTFFLRSQVRN